MSSYFFKFLVCLLLVFTQDYAVFASDHLKRFYFVSSNTLNVRSEPTTSAKIVKALKRGEEIKTVQKTADGKWWKIRSPVKGFVYARYITVKERAPSNTASFLDDCPERNKKGQKKDSVLIIGIQYGLATPQSQSLEKGTTIGLTFDQQNSKTPWLGFRLAVNQMDTSIKDKGLTVSLSDFRFSTTSIYFAYRPGFPIFRSEASSSGLVNELRFFPLLGVAAMAARVENKAMNFNETITGGGLIAGGGLMMTWEYLAVGFEYLLIHQKAIFDRSGEMYTGSNQMLLTIGMVF